MSTLDKIAFFQNRGDEVPNQELAKALAATDDLAGIREIADNLTNKNPNIRSDCIKAIYEIGYLRPDLIGGYVTYFLSLLHSKDNSMVWGTMNALACIANLQPDNIYSQFELVIQITRRGTVISQVWGMRTLS